MFVFVCVGLLKLENSTLAGIFHHFSSSKNETIQPLWKKNDYLTFICQYLNNTEVPTCKNVIISTARDVLSFEKWCNLF